MCWATFLALFYQTHLVALNLAAEVEPLTHKTWSMQKAQSLSRQWTETNECIILNLLGDLLLIRNLRQVCCCAPLKTCHSNRCKRCFIKASKIVSLSCEKVKTNPLECLKTACNYNRYITSLLLSTYVKVSFFLSLTSLKSLDFHIFVSIPKCMYV
jgi:hypothetical protein